MLPQTTAIIRLHVIRIVIKPTQEKKANRSLSIFSSLSIIRQRSPLLSPTAWNSLGAFLQTDGITRHLELHILQFGDIFSAQRLISTRHYSFALLNRATLRKRVEPAFPHPSTSSTAWASFIVPANQLISIAPRPSCMCPKQCNLGFNLRMALSSLPHPQVLPSLFASSL
jgi:hypothetical protein